MKCTGKCSAITTGIVIFIIIAITLILSLVLSSLNSINYDEYGIKYNTISRYIDYDKIYEEGLHVEDPDTKMFKYIRTIQSLNMTEDAVLDCMTYEGLEMRLDITFKYQIQKNDLFDIFNDFAEEEYYTKFLKKFSRSVMKNVCPYFTGEDFFFKRGEIEIALGEELDKIFNEEDNDIYSNYKSVQLRNVEHPERYKNANEEKQRVIQEADRAIKEREEKLTKEETILLTTIEDAEIKLIQANATSNAIIAEAEHIASAKYIKWKERADAFVIIKNSLGYTSGEEFLSYLKYIIISSAEDPFVKLKFDA